MIVGVAVGVSATGGGFPADVAAAIITVADAGVTPAAQSMTEGDLVSSVANFATIDNTANFESTAGTISTVEWISGGSDRAGSYALPAAASLVVRVTDSAANVREWTIDASVAYEAPTVTASDNLETRTLTITRDSLTGTGATVALTTLTLDGVDVLGDAVEVVAGQQWSYEVPSSASSQAVVWEITASNPGGSDAASGSEVVPADWILPSYTVSLGAVVDGQTVGIPASGADVEAVLGGSPGSPDDPLTWEISVNGGAYASLASPYTASEGEELVIRISDTDHPAGSFSATSAPVTVSGAVVIDFTSLTVADQVGDSVDVTVVSEGATQKYLSMVLIPDASPAIVTPARIRAGQYEDGSTAPIWLDHYSFTGDLTDQTVAFDYVEAVSGNYTAYAVISDAAVGGNVSVIRSDATIAIDTTVDAWEFTGSVVATIPTNEGWVFTGSVVTTIPS